MMSWRRINKSTAHTGCPLGHIVNLKCLICRERQRSCKSNAVLQSIFSKMPLILDAQPKTQSRSLISESRRAQQGLQIASMFKLWKMKVPGVPPMEYQPCGAVSPQSCLVLLPSSANLPNSIALLLQILPHLKPPAAFENQSQNQSSNSFQRPREHEGKPCPSDLLLNVLTKLNRIW